MNVRKTRLTPRISANKLGEYLTAKPGRRLTIISDQKHPRDFIVARYKAAFEAISEAIAAGNDARVIGNAIARLYDSKPKSMWQQNDVELSIEALDLFLNIIDDVDTTGFIVRRSTEAALEMKIEGVDVSVRPELLLADPSTGAVRGAIKLLILKSNKAKDGEEPDDSAASYVGAVLHQYVNDVLSPNDKVPPARCNVIDVFGQKVHSAPKSFKRRRDDIAAGCREIARGWAEA